MQNEAVIIGLFTMTVQNAHDLHHQRGVSVTICGNAAHGAASFSKEKSTNSGTKELLGKACACVRVRVNMCVRVCVCLNKNKTIVPLYVLRTNSGRISDAE